MEKSIKVVDLVSDNSSYKKRTNSFSEEKEATQEAKKMLLGDLWESAYRAHCGTSFSPERRANSYIKDYSEELAADLKELGDNQGNYKEKYISKFGDWMGAKSRCISSMITGGSNFPVRRAQKANSSERNHSEAFHHWRVKYFTAVNRVPTKSPEDEIEAAEKRLEFLVVMQLEMKEINAEIRECKIKDLRELINHLVELGYRPELVKLLDNFYGKQSGKYKIPGFTLTNNNAKIKSTEQKLKVMQNRIVTKNNWEDIIFEGGRVTIEDDRVKVFHDEKPEKEIIQEIKSNGFRWSPNWGCWCRKHTGNAIFATKRLSFIQSN